MDHYDYVVVGSGVAGITCLETLCTLDPAATIGLVSVSQYIKYIGNVQHITRLIENFEVKEKPWQEASNEWRERGFKVTILLSQVEVVNIDKREVLLSGLDGNKFRVQYDKLCWCAGARPKLLVDDSPLVIGLRDVESVDDFQKKLSSARRLVLVGNGGIATELAYEIRNCEIIWAIKDASISTTFLDSSAAAFLIHEWRDETQSGKEASQKPPLRYDVAGRAYELRSVKGSALGPYWSQGRTFSGAVSNTNFDSTKPDYLKIEYNVEVESIQFNESAAAANSLPNWPVTVKLTNGKEYGCDLVISAIGVVPNIPIIESSDASINFQLANPMYSGSKDGCGLLIDKQMRCHLTLGEICRDIYAAGDCCAVNWPVMQMNSDCPHWFQMKLWSQARQMGFRAAVCMHTHHRRDETEEVPLDFCFELFTHITQFFGRKVILLGRYNAQGLRSAELGTPHADDYELLLRISKGQEYVKCVMQNGRLQGCTLIGDTDLEETFENLILNQLDLTPYGEDLLNPDIDIEDYFD